MIFKEGIGWRCCYDPETGLYTAEVGGGMDFTLYEITKEIFERVGEPGAPSPADLIGAGRKLYIAVNDRCGPPYTVIFDSDYEKLCPWTRVQSAGRAWEPGMTDAAVELLASEADNRAQRRAKRAKHDRK